MSQFFFMSNCHILGPYHQLYYAGYITASVRGIIWETIKNNIKDIIAIETDGIFSSKPLNVNIGLGLGQWEQEIYDEIVYVQSGVYWLRRKKDWYTKNRGLDTGALELEDVLSAYRHIRNTGEFTVSGKSTNFITYGAAMSSHTWLQWGQWIETEKRISIVPEGKRRLHDDYELVDYDQCYKKLIPSLPRLVENVESELYEIPWKNGPKPKEIDLVEVN